MPSSPILNSHYPPKCSQVMVYVQKLRRSQRAGGLLWTSTEQHIPSCSPSSPDSLWRLYLGSAKYSKYSGSWFLFPGQIGLPALSSWSIPSQLNSPFSVGMRCSPQAPSSADISATLVSRWKVWGPGLQKPEIIFSRWSLKRVSGQSVMGSILLLKLSPSWRSQTCKSGRLCLLMVVAVTEV